MRGRPFPVLTAILLTSAACAPSNRSLPPLSDPIVLDIAAYNELVRSYYDRFPDFDSRDVSGDGYLSLEEWRDSRTHYVFVFDMDGDGLLTQGEFLLHICGAAPYRPADACVSLHRGRFAELDESRDGRLAWMEVGGHTARNFENLDICGDGLLSHEEMDGRVDLVNGQWVHATGGVMCGASMRSLF